MDEQQPQQGPGELPAASRWRRTDKWKPAQTGTASGGFGVESDDSRRLGLCKPKDVAPEKICADLARAVGVKVPEVELGNVEGHSGTVAVSMAHGKVSIDLQHLQQQHPNIYSSPRMTEALRVASDLLVFHTWVGTGDLKDAHLVVAGSEAEGYVVAAVDFADALRWQPTDPVQAPAGPSSLVQNPDPQVIRAAVERIENCEDATIEAIVNAIPDGVLPDSEKGRVMSGLKARRAKVREVMRQRGWLP